MLYLAKIYGRKDTFMSLAYVFIVRIINPQQEMWGHIQKGNRMDDINRMATTNLPGTISLRGTMQLGGSVIPEGSLMVGIYKKMLALAELRK